MGISAFFSWWRDELAGMLPDAWRRRFERAPKACTPSTSQRIMLQTLI